MQDDRWHGPEDYPGPIEEADFTRWEGEFPMAPWTRWDTFLRRALMVGGCLAVWSFLVMLLILMFKEVKG